MILSRISTHVSGTICLNGHGGNHGLQTGAGSPNVRHQKGERAMIDERAVQQLIDQAAISRVVTAYATAVDSRDWALFRTLFTDRVFIDFRTFHPSLYRDVPLDELVSISQGLEGFDATQHLSTNHVHAIDGDRATCVSYMHAGHFLKRDGQDHACFLYGHYSYHLLRQGDVWLIDRYGLQVTAQHGNPQVFEWAGMR